MLFKENKVSSMDYLSLPSNAVILIDTNFLIDSFSDQISYLDFFKKIKEQNRTIVSIDLVKCEFIRSQNKQIVENKVDYFNQFVETILPFDQKISQILQSIIEEYAEDGIGVSVVDFYLACFIKRYQKLYLLTRNHKDFPTRIFQRSCIFSIGLRKDIKTYALYQYSPKEKKLIEEINPDDIPL